jgi:hypothetical protein
MRVKILIMLAAISLAAMSQQCYAGIVFGKPYDSDENINNTRPLSPKRPSHISPMRKKKRQDFQAPQMTILFPIYGQVVTTEVRVQPASPLKTENKENENTTNLNSFESPSRKKQTPRKTKEGSPNKNPKQKGTLRKTPPKIKNEENKENKENKENEDVTNLSPVSSGKSSSRKKQTPRKTKKSSSSPYKEDLEQHPSPYKCNFLVPRSLKLEKDKDKISSSLVVQNLCKISIYPNKGTASERDLEISKVLSNDPMPNEEWLINWLDWMKEVIQKYGESNPRTTGLLLKMLDDNKEYQVIVPENVRLNADVDHNTFQLLITIPGGKVIFMKVPG